MGKAMFDIRQCELIMKRAVSTLLPGFIALAVTATTIVTAAAQPTEAAAAAIRDANALSARIRTS
jgi:hypothetical protein